MLLLPPSARGRSNSKHTLSQGTLPCGQQQAYLCNCLDTVLRARIDREASITTPVYTPINGLVTCIAILDQTFLEKYPIHTRRKHFFNARQKEGQSALEFREELLSLLEEADGANIFCNDLICMMLRLGCLIQTCKGSWVALEIPP